MYMTVQREVEVQITPGQTFMSIDVFLHPVSLCYDGSRWSFTVGGKTRQRGRELPALTCHV